MNIAKYSKGLIALEGLACQGVEMYLGVNNKYAPLITGALAGILLILVPNTSAIPPTVLKSFPETMPSRDLKSPPYSKKELDVFLAKEKSDITEDFSEMLVDKVAAHEPPPMAPPPDSEMPK